MSPLEDTYILQAKRGNEEALKFVAEYVFRVVPGYVIPRYNGKITFEDAEDAIIHALTKFITQTDQVRATTSKSFMSWLMRTVDHYILDILKSSSYKRNQSMYIQSDQGEEYEIQVAGDDEDSIIDSLSLKFESEELDLALLELSLIDRQIVVGFYYQNLSIGYIAQQVGITEVNARKRKGRALTTLRKILS